MNAYREALRTSEHFIPWGTWKDFGPAREAWTNEAETGSPMYEHAGQQVSTPFQIELFYVLLVDKLIYYVLDGGVGSRLSPLAAEITMAKLSLAATVGRRSCCWRWGGWWAGCDASESRTACADVPPQSTTTVP